MTISDPKLRPSAPPPSRADDADSHGTVLVLKQLLAQSIYLRDLYKHARLKMADNQYHRLRQLFDANYREQVALVDVLIDRTRAVGGICGVLAGDLLYTGQFSESLRGRASIIRLLRALLDAHEMALSAAQPVGTNEIQEDPAWTHDFAVERVVLTNCLQRNAISEQLMSDRRDQELVSRVPARSMTETAELTGHHRQPYSDSSTSEVDAGSSE